MRDYGKVHSSFWSSPTIRGMSDDGKTLALYLMTSPHTTIAGVFRLPDGYACEDLGWSSGRVAKGFEELFAKGFANRCETTKWVWIVKHLDWNPPENPNQRKAAAKCADLIPAQCSWKSLFYEVSGVSLGMKEPEDPNPCETVPEPFLNQKQEQEQKQKKEKAPAAPSLSIEELEAEGLDRPTATEFLAHRKRKGATLTALAWKGFKTEAGKAGWPLANAVEKAIARGWVSFEAAWVASDPKPNGARAPEKTKSLAEMGLA